MADFAFVRVEQRGGCAWVTLDRPPLNLIVPEMIRGIKAAFEELREDPRVRAAVLTGESISARQALEWGLVNRVAPSAALGQATAELIDRVLECAPVAVRLQKELIIRWRNTNLRSAVEFGIDAFAQAYATEEPREAMQAFLDKRKPRFHS